MLDRELQRRGDPHRRPGARRAALSGFRVRHGAGPEDRGDRAAEHQHGGDGDPDATTPAAQGVRARRTQRLGPGGRVVWSGRAGVWFRGWRRGTGAVARRTVRSSRGLPVLAARARRGVDRLGAGRLEARRAARSAVESTQAPRKRAVGLRHSSAAADEPLVTILPACRPASARPTPQTALSTVLAAALLARACSRPPRLGRRRRDAVEGTKVGLQHETWGSSPGDALSQTKELRRSGRRNLRQPGRQPGAARQAMCSSSTGTPQDRYHPEWQQSIDTFLAECQAAERQPTSLRGLTAVHRQVERRRRDQLTFRGAYTDRAPTPAGVEPGAAGDIGLKKSPIALPDRPNRW